MRVNCYWICQEPDCGFTNLSQLDTTKPRLVLVCEICEKPQGYQVVLSAIVQDAPRIRREVLWPDPMLPALPLVPPLDPPMPSPMNRPHDVKEKQP